MGGICSENEEATITNCYNVGNGIKYENEGWNASGWSEMAGIANNSQMGKISNCYTIGEIPPGKYSNDSRAAICLIYTNDNGIHSNNYYNIETCISNDDIAIGLTTTEMKSEDFLSKLGESFIEDTEGINNGYPILKWQQN